MIDSVKGKLSLWSRAVSAWMDRSSDRANMLDFRYVITGVGVAFSQDGRYLYITQMFEGPY